MFDYQRCSFVFAYRGKGPAIGVLLFVGAAMKFLTWLLCLEFVNLTAILCFLAVTFSRLRGRNELLPI